MKTVVLLCIFFYCTDASSAIIWEVGPNRTYTRSSQVSGLVQNGDTVNIDAETYIRDVTFWRKNNLLLRGVGGLVHLDAKKTAYGRKGIWVIGGDSVTVENIEFSHSIDAAKEDENWAGIRLEGTNLTVKNCYFHDNDNGILEGNNSTSDVVIIFSEFDHNGYGDGQSHNLYIGNAKSLTFMHNYSHHAVIGHELKTRVRQNYILYNRIGNEQQGTSSREIDMPNGGLAVIIGN